MRVVRSAGQNVSPSDDGRLYDQIFTDGLFEDTTITNLGANNIALGTLYGVICGRDFTAEAQTIAAVLPEGDTEETGYIYVEIDTSSDDVITINSALAPFTPTYEDINTNGAVVQMILAEYTASAVAVTSITPTYSKASAGTVLPGSVATVEQSQAVSNHSVGEYIMLGGQLYKVTRAISAGETITPGSNVSATSAGAELNELNNDLTSLDSLISAITFPTRLLNSSIDMNNVDCGTYFQSGSSMPKNAPSGANNAYIIVLKARTYDRIQIWISINAKNVQIRSTASWNAGAGTGTDWSAWKTL